MEDSTTTPSAHLRTPTEPPFVGRRREMASLRRAADDALEGRTRIVALAGEPGIGKTRLAHETAAYASQHGFQIFWGRCHEGEWAPPYWPWIQIMQSYLSSSDSESIQALMGKRAIHIGDVVDEVRDMLPELPHSEPAEPQVRRFLFFEAITYFMKRASQLEPLFLIIDNLHCADTSSLHLLEFLAQNTYESPMLVLATYRNLSLSASHPIIPSLGELARNPSFEQLSLLPLSAEEVTDFIQTATSTDIPLEITHALYDRTEGNPLYIAEMAKLLGSYDLRSLGNEDVSFLDEIGIPETVQLAIGQRLSHLNESCRTVVTTAAVMGHEFSTRRLSRLMGLVPEESVQPGIDEARKVGIIEEIAESADKYRFTHKLIQKVAARELSAARRALLHMEIATMLEEQYGADSRKHAEELARHFEQADNDELQDKTAYYARLAGEAALAAYSFEEAAAHFNRAVAAGQNIPMDKEKAVSLFGLGQAQLALYMLDESLDNLEQAFDYFEKNGDTEGMAAIAGHHRLIAFVDRIEKRIANWVERALAVTPDGSPKMAPLLGVHANHAYLSNWNYEQAQSAIDQALEISLKQGDVAAAMAIYDRRWTINFVDQRYSRAYSDGLRILEMADAENDKYFTVVGNLHAGQSAIYLDDGEASWRHREAALRTAEEFRDRSLLREALQTLAFSCYKAGQAERARKLDSRSLRIINSQYRGNAQIIIFAFRAYYEYQAGYFQEGDALYSKLLEIYRQSPSGSNRRTLLGFLPYFAYFKATTEHIDKAIEIEKTHPVSEERFFADSFPIVSMGFAMMAVLTNEKNKAAKFLKDLTDNGKQGFSGENQRTLGLISQTAGDYDFAFSCFEKGLAHGRKAINYLEEAWCCHDWGKALIEQANARDGGISTEQARKNVEKARGLLEAGLQITRRLGMAPLQIRITSLLESVAKPGKKQAYPAGLTQREVEVLREIASGKTNQEISHALSISENTVANHAKNIMAKIGVSNRVDAALFAVKRGLARDM